jgi:hypothetical protein
MIKTRELKIEQLLPTDEEVAQWYDANIDDDIATVSSSIYKFRLWLKDRLLEQTKPIVHNIHGYLYEEKKKLTK